jgi:toxin ParE1/3/4
MKPLLRSARADADVEEAVDYLLAEAPDAVAGFIDDLEQAFAHIGRHPATGSPRYGHELDLPGVRHWPCKRHPYLVFYLEQHDRILVVRVLDGRRDIPQWLQQEG